MPLPWQRVQQAVRAPSAWWTTRNSVGTRAVPPTQEGQSVHQRQRGSRQVPDVPPECGGGPVALPRPRGAPDERDSGWGRCSRAPITVGADGRVFDRASEGPLQSEIKSIRLGWLVAFPPA